MHDISIILLCLHYDQSTNGAFKALSSYERWHANSFPSLSGNKWDERRSVMALNTSVSFDWSHTSLEPDRSHLSAVMTLNSSH